MLVWRLRGKIIRTAPCCVVYDSCAQWYAHRCEQFLTVRWTRFCHTGPISLCADLWLYFECFCFTLHSCCIIVSTVGWTCWDWSLLLGTSFLQCSDTDGWVIWSVKCVPGMTYNVFGGTLNLAQDDDLQQSSINAPFHQFRWLQFTWW